MKKLGCESGAAVAIDPALELRSEGGGGGVAGVVSVGLGSRAANYMWRS